MKEIHYDHKFRLNQDKFSIGINEKIIYYIKLLNDDQVVVEWEENGKWDRNTNFTKSDFENYIEEGHWVLVP